MPASICPVRIEVATVPMAVREEAHARFVVAKAVDGGKPACRAAIRPAFEPPSSLSTVPT